MFIIRTKTITQTMCLAIPGKILDIDTSCSLRMATVDFGGIHKSICIQYVDAEPGDFILAHAGMAITRRYREVSEATLEDLKILADNLNPDIHVVRKTIQG